MIIIFIAPKTWIGTEMEMGGGDEGGEGEASVVHAPATN